MKRSKFADAEAIDPGDVEDPRGFGDTALAVVVLAGLIGLDRIFPVEDDEGGLLALADLWVERLPLAIGAPQRMRVSVEPRRCRSPRTT